MPYVVLDDDPTGVQTLAGVRVLLRWEAADVRAALDGRPAVHLITNTRALEPGGARSLVAAAARTALDAVPDARILLRGDSTLRGHVHEEYLGLRDVVSPRRWPALLLVPALPSAGRVTVGGVHQLERDGNRVPVAETEFARDGGFAYASARLLDWAGERSDGFFRPERGREIWLDELRRTKGATVAATLVELSESNEPAALAVDAEDETDLDSIAAGYRTAVAGGASVIVRCAPAFAGIVAGTSATTFAELPAPGRGVLLVCGSYVAQTTRQLARMVAARPDSLVEADVVALAGDGAEHEVTRLAAAAARSLAADGFAALATPRERLPGASSLAAGERIALGLARITAAIDPRPSVVVAKGGITSALVLREGIGAGGADVVGPVVQGVSRWATRWPDGSPVDYLVVPGNVGDDGLLARLVNALLAGAARPIASSR